jgi:hypothetical protein
VAGRPRRVDVLGPDARAHEPRGAAGRRPRSRSLQLRRRPGLRRPRRRRGAGRHPPRSTWRARPLDRVDLGGGRPCRADRAGRRIVEFCPGLGAVREPVALGGRAGSDLQRLPGQAGREPARWARRLFASRGGRGFLPSCDRAASGSPGRLLQPGDGPRDPGPLPGGRGAAAELHGAGAPRRRGARAPGPHVPSRGALRGGDPLAPECLHPEA